MALCSKTYYCWDSDGRDKLSSKGLQKMANANGLAYKVYHHARVIMNNMQATHPCLVSDWFTHKFHLYDISIIYLGQNVSHKDPSHRTISLNANYVVLFKNPRDMSQISHLDKQVYPGGNSILTAAFQDTTVMRAPSYMELTSTRQCLRNFACTTLYFLMKTFLRHLHTGPPPGPEEVGRSVAAKTTKGPPLFTNRHSPWQQQPVQQKSTSTALAVSNSANDGPQQQQQQQQCRPSITAPMIIAVAWQLHRNNHSKAMMPGLTPRCDPLQLSQARKCHMYLEQGSAQGREAADSWC